MYRDLCRAIQSTWAQGHFSQLSAKFATEPRMKCLSVLDIYAFAVIKILSELCCQANLEHLP